MSCQTTNSSHDNRMLNQRLSFLLIAVVLGTLATGLLIFKKNQSDHPPLPFDEYFVEYKQSIPEYEGPEKVNGLCAATLWKANKGVHVFDRDGNFRFPDEVKRVWIDVGASRLETTRTDLFTQNDLAVIAVEPLPDCWNTWPKMDRLIAIPFAMHEVEGPQIFHQTKAHNWSSLLDQIPLGDNLYAEAREVVKEIPVEVYRLSRVLELIPESMPIEVLKVDVQGVDYEVLKSAGDQLKRVKEVIVEINLVQLYDGDHGNETDPEKPFNDLLGQHGFVQQSRTEWEMGDRRSTEQPIKVYADVTFVNQNFLRETSAQ